MENTNTIKFTYKLSTDGQRAAILAGAPAHELRSEEIPITPARLALATIDAAGRATIDKAPLPWGGYEYVTVETHDSDPTAALDGRIKAIEKKIADEAAAERAEREQWECELAVSAAYVAANPGARYFVGLSVVGARLGGEGGIWINNSTRVHQPGRVSTGLVSAPAREHQRQIHDWLDTVLARSSEDNRAAEELAKKRKLAAAQSAAAERDAWIRSHGSERLRKCLDLGMIETCGGIYRDERLALDFPGWIMDGDDTEKESEIRNPSIKALAALEEARKISPDATLVKVRPAYLDDTEGAGWREAVRLADLPGITSSKVFYRLID